MGGPPASGGELLRTLREEAGLSLLDVASRLDDHRMGAADMGASRSASGAIDAAHLQRIETGQIRRPRPATVGRVLDALDATFRQRRAVLGAYGYTAAWTLPTDREVEEARRMTAHELAGATWPVWLSDHGQALWAWNRYFPRLLGLSPDDPALARFAGVTIVDLALNPTIGTGSRIGNPEVYLPMMLQFIKVTLAPFAEDPWCAALVERWRGLPGFSTTWDALSSDLATTLATQAIVPMAVQIPSITTPFQFRLVSVNVTADPRFNVVHWIPYGAATLRQLAVWADEEGVP